MHYGVQYRNYRTGRNFTRTFPKIVPKFVLQNLHVLFSLSLSGFLHGAGVPGSHSQPTARLVQFGPLGLGGLRRKHQCITNCDSNHLHRRVTGTKVRRYENLSYLVASLERSFLTTVFMLATPLQSAGGVYWNIAWHSGLAIIFLLTSLCDEASLAFPLSRSICDRWFIVCPFSHLFESCLLHHAIFDQKMVSRKSIMPQQRREKIDCVHKTEHDHSSMLSMYVARQRWLLAVYTT